MYVGHRLMRTEDAAASRCSSPLVIYRLNTFLSVADKLRKLENYHHPKVTFYSSLKECAWLRVIMFSKRKHEIHCGNGAAYATNIRSANIAD